MSSSHWKRFDAFTETELTKNGRNSKAVAFWENLVISYVNKDLLSKSSCLSFSHEHQRKAGLLLKAEVCTFLQEPVVGGISGSSRERRLPVGTPGDVGLRFAKNGDKKRT